MTTNQLDLQPFALCSPYTRMVDLTHLRYFHAIAESGSMTAAAKALGVSQPTLTVAMQNLEDGLKTTVFLRERTGVRLTATGEELFRHAEQVFLTLERAERRIFAMEHDDEGSFVVSCHESLGAYFLPKFMSRFLSAHPGIEILIANTTSPKTEEAVLDRTADFGLVVNANPHPDLVILKLFHDAMDVMIAIDAPPPSRPVQPSRDSLAPDTVFDPRFYDATVRLRTGPIIYAARVGQCQELVEKLVAMGLPSARRLVCGDLEMVKSLALAGIGVALLPRRVAAYGHEGKLTRLHHSLPFIPDVISLIYRADSHKTSAAKIVKDALVAFGKELESDHEEIARQA
jgi:molybdate transport repressor ModE-like protein